MGQLAMLFRQAGHEVSGSDVLFDPPMGPALRAASIRCDEGYREDHIVPGLDLVVIGNAIRRDNPEALRAEALNLPRTSMSGALRDYFLSGRTALVVAGTHGKTTTASMCAWILQSSGFEPGFFIGGLPKNFESGAAIGSTKRKITLQESNSSAFGRAPFVVEGDEYDAVYWQKRAKFFDYLGAGPNDVAIITSVEHDHVDIYPSRSEYEAAFERFAEQVSPKGLIAVDARDPVARRISLAQGVRARVAYYGLEGDDTGEVTPTWLGVLAPAEPLRNCQPFDLYAGGSYCGRFELRVPGAHNVRNAVGAIAACAEGLGVGVSAAKTALASFEGVRRRQDLLGQPDGVNVYDDFAHHPTAVAETLHALRTRHPAGELWAVFEPRSATACRALHQEAYARAFDGADHVLLAPLGRANIPAEERLDVDKLANDIGARALAARGVDEILHALQQRARPGDTVALLSNGAFGGIHARLLRQLADRENKA